MIGYIYLAAAVLLFVIGIFIKVKKVTWLISGYNTASAENKEKYDIDKLCYYIGNFMYALATVWLLMAVLVFIYPNRVECVTGAGIAVETIVMVAGMIFLNTNNRVMKK